MHLKKESAKIFIGKLNQKSKNKYRIPTKEEWYWFATGGIKSSDEVRGINKEKSKNILDYAWCDNNSNGAFQEVGNLKPNELGLYDIWGNVSEITTTISVGGALTTKKKKMIKGDSYVNSFMWDNEEEDPYNMGIRLVITANN